MGYLLSREAADAFFDELSLTYDIYAPKRFPKQGRFSDTDIIRYSKVENLSEIEFVEKSHYPMKEVITPIQQAVFYFTEDEFRASKHSQRPILIFARPCDINAQEIQAKIYGGNGGFTDFYYERVKDLVHYALMDCSGGDDTCFCVSMGTNTTDNYEFAVKMTAEGLYVDNKNEVEALKSGEKVDFTPKFVMENELKVNVPEIPDREILNKLKEHPVWNEFNGRCISCGACTVACSTCTCFTTRDIIYGDNPEVGERRRVTSSCQISGFTDMAGGASYRPTAGDRMRFKMLHKFHDYKERFKERDMCVGCGRCTARCPEFISITTSLKKMAGAIDELVEERAKEGK